MEELYLNFRQQNYMLEKYGRIDILSLQLEQRQILLDTLVKNKSFSTILLLCLQNSLLNDIDYYKKDISFQQKEQIGSNKRRLKDK